MKRGARGVESSGVLLGRLINARAAVEATRAALQGARAAGAGEAVKRLRGVRASLGGVVRHVERLYHEASAREFRERQETFARLVAVGHAADQAYRCVGCGAWVWTNGSGGWVDAMGRDACRVGVHAPADGLSTDGGMP